MTTIGQTVPGTIDHTMSDGRVCVFTPFSYRMFGQFETWLREQYPDKYKGGIPTGEVMEEAMTISGMGQMLYLSAVAHPEQNMSPDELLQNIGGMTDVAALFGKLMDIGSSEDDESGNVEAAR